MGLNWKCPFLPFTYSITYRVECWYFKCLCNTNTAWNRTYLNFCDKSLVRPGSKYPNWQKSQPTSCKAKFSLRDNVYLVDLKYNISYQNIRGKTKVIPISIWWNALNGKKVTLQLTWMSFLQNLEDYFNRERLPISYQN